MKKTTFIFTVALCSANLHAQTPKIIEYVGGFMFEAATPRRPRRSVL